MSMLAEQETPFRYSTRRRSAHRARRPIFVGPSGSPRAWVVCSVIALTTVGGGSLLVLAMGLSGATPGEYLPVADPAGTTEQLTDQAPGQQVAPSPGRPARGVPPVSDPRLPGPSAVPVPGQPPGQPVSHPSAAPTSSPRPPDPSVSIPASPSASPTASPSPSLSPTPPAPLPTTPATTPPVPDETHGRPGAPGQTKRATPSPSPTPSDPDEDGEVMSGPVG